MATNLWNVYKGFYQRLYRSDKSHYDYDLKFEMTKIAHEIVHQNLNEDQILSRARKLYDLEICIFPKVYFSSRIINSVENGDYYIGIPDEINHKNRFKNRHGYIYIFISPESKPNQSKIGATVSMSVKKRAIKYSTKYGYSVDIFSYFYVAEPFALEEKVKRNIIDLRVLGNTEMDSIEWYWIEPSKLKDLIIELAKNN